MYEFAKIFIVDGRQVLLSRSSIFGIYIITAEIFGNDVLKGKIWPFIKKEIRDGAWDLFSQKDASNALREIEAMHTTLRPIAEA